jgi:hypothetical protein
VIVRPDLPARLALHLRPAVIEDAPDGDGDGDEQASWAGPEAVGAWR